jgi:AcrR family transcriptional regulator
MPDRGDRTIKDGRSTRWAGQRERRRREFVDAALQAIAEYGPDVSTEQIAAAAGVARTQLYKHFTDATELRMAIADRAKELLSGDLRLWELHGSPMQMIESGVRAHLTWLSEHRNLYRYLNRHSRVTLSDERDPITDVKTAIGRQLTILLEAYHERFGLDPRVAQPTAFGIVGMVDAAAARWLDDPLDLSQDQLTSLLSGWVWLIADSNLRVGGIERSPHAPMEAPDLSDEPPPPEMRSSP